nr:protein SRC1-like [Ipomoea trifida]
MSGIIHKIEEKLHMGGHKEEEKHHDKAEGHHSGEHKAEHCGGGEHKAEHKGEHKEGLVEKVKDKIHGEGDPPLMDLICRRWSSVLLLMRYMVGVY